MPNHIVHSGIRRPAFKSNEAKPPFSLTGMDVLECGIEDDEVNFTRFILLARQPVGALIPPGMSAKTTTLFLIDNKAGSLYKALACFALRDIDLTKCESRPTSVQLLNYLAMSDPSAKSTQTEEQRFRYCFYLDYIASELDPNAQAALAHLRCAFLVI